MNPYGMAAICRRITLSACLVSILICSSALAGSVVVSKYDVRPVASVSSGRYIDIAWRVELHNTTSTPQICDITLSFLDAEDVVVGTAAKTQELDPLQEKRVKGRVRLRSSVAQQIVATDVSVETR